MPAFAPSEAYYRALVESTLDVVIVYDAEGKVRDASPSVLTVFGFAPDDVVGRPGIEFVHPEDVETLRTVLAAAAGRPGRRVRAELRLRHRDGSYRVMDSSIANLLHEPSVAGLVVASRDVTEMRETAAQLVHAQRMEAVGQLAESVAHEFKNAPSRRAGRRVRRRVARSAERPGRRPWRGAPGRPPIAPPLDGDRGEPDVRRAPRGPRPRARGLGLLDGPRVRAVPGDRARRPALIEDGNAPVSTPVSGRRRSRAVYHPGP